MAINNNRKKTFKEILQERRSTQRQGISRVFSGANQRQTLADKRKFDITKGKQALVDDTALTTEAKRLDTELSKVPFNNLTEATKFYSEIPSNIRARMSFKESDFNKAYNKQIEDLQTRIKKIEKKEKSAKKDGDKAKRSGYREELRELDKILTSVTKSKSFINVTDAIIYADDVGDAKKNKTKLKQANSPQGKTIRTTIKVGGQTITGVKDSKGTFFADDTKELAQAQKIKNVPLSGLEKASVNKIADKVAETGQVTKAQRDKFKELGLDTNLLNKIAVDTIKYNRALNDIDKIINQNARQGTNKYIDIKELLNKYNLNINQVESLISYQTTKEFLPSNVKTSKVDDFIKDNPNVVTDRDTQKQLYKIGVNESLKSLGLSPISTTQDISVFEKRYKERVEPQIKALEFFTNEKINKFTEILNEERDKKITNIQFKRLLKNSDNRKQLLVIAKVNEGKRLTTQEQKIFDSIVKESQLKRAKPMLDVLLSGTLKGSKAFVLSPYNAGKPIVDWLGNKLGDIVGEQGAELYKLVKGKTSLNEFLDTRNKNLNNSVTSALKSYNDGKTTLANLKRRLINISKNPKVSLEVLSTIVVAVAIATGIALPKILSSVNQSLKKKVIELSKDKNKLRNAKINLIAGVIEVGIDLYTSRILAKKVTKVKGLKNFSKFLRGLNLSDREINDLNEIIKKYNKNKNAKTLTSILKVINKKTGLSLSNKDIPVFNRKETLNLIKLLSKNKLKNAYQKIDFDVKTNFRPNKKTGLLDKTSTITGKGKAILENGKEIAIEYKLRADKLGNLRGEYKLGSEDSYIKVAVQLEDNGAFYINKKTGEKISKVAGAIKESKIEIQQAKQIIENSKIDMKGSNIGVTKTSTITQLLTKIFLSADKKLNNVKVTKERVSKVGSLGFKMPFGYNKIIGVISDKLSTVVKTTTKGIKGIGKPLTKKEIKFLEDFLVSIDYDKNILNGMDKRTRLARALGLRKDSKAVSGIMEIVNDKGEVIAKVAQKIKVKSKGVLEKGIKPIPKPKKRIKFKRFGSLRSNKKGSFSFIQGDTMQSEIAKANKFIPSTKIKIPNLSFDLPLTASRLRKLGLVRDVGSIFFLLKGIDKLKFIDSKKDNKKLNKDLREIRKISSRVQKKLNDDKNKRKVDFARDLKTDKVKKKSLKKVPKQPSKLSKSKIKPKNDKTRPPRPPSIPRKRIDPIVPIIQIPLPQLKRSTKLPRGYRLKYDAKYKENGKVKVAKLGLPENKAYRKILSAVDQATQRSVELYISGITRQKDTKLPKELLSKFRKGVTARTLRLVEKTENAIDTQGEKRGLKLSRILAGKKSKPKKKNTKKTTTKNKKKVTKKNVKRTNKPKSKPKQKKRIKKRTTKKNNNKKSKPIKKTKRKVNRKTTKRKNKK